MELRHLRYFVAAAQLGSIRRAAAALNVAQPAISRQIKDLQEDIGVVVFQKVGRGFQLSPAGEAFHTSAIAILRQVDSACDHARRVAAGEDGELRLGFIESASWSGVMPNCIRRFRASYPRVRLQLKSLSSREVIRQLNEGTLDIGVAYRFDEDKDLLKSKCVQVDSIVLAAPRDWRPGKRLHLQQLCDESFVSFPRAVAPSYYDVLLSACAAGGLRPRFTDEADTEATMLSFVSAGAGLAFVNSANQNRRPSQVNFHPISDLNLRLELHCMWTSNPSAAAKSMVDLFSSDG